MIILKTSEEIEIMARASRVVAETLAMLRREVRPGITTDELDRLAEQFIRSHGGTPAFKGYRNYPKTLCASINDQVVHGIPSKRALKKAILSVWISVRLWRDSMGIRPSQWLWEK